MALSILEQIEDAEDAVSKVFLRIAEKNWGTVRSIKSDKDLRNYLLKATKNTALTMLETRKRTAADIDTVLEFSTNGIADLSDDAFVETVCNRVEVLRVTEAMLLLLVLLMDCLSKHPRWRHLLASIYLQKPLI